MRHIFTLLLLLVCFQVKAQNISFDKMEHDFGTVTEGTIAKHNFVFKNVSPKSITLKDVKASCGCTTPNWPKEAVLPGKSATIEVQYNSQGRPGPFNKSITVTTSDSTATPQILLIKGTVNPAQNANQTPKAN